MRDPAKPWPAWPVVTEKALADVAETLRTRRWAITGDWTGTTSRERLFSQRFANYVGVDHCVPTCNGSAALVVALEALGIGCLDEVIVPGLTWVASATAVLRVNAVPVPVDIDWRTLCMDPAAVRAAITPRTRAICVVHLYSVMADMDALLAIALEFGIPVLEDCAQAHGARWHGGVMAGALGAIGAFSFQEGKVLASGEGGAAVTSDVALAARLEPLRADGRRLSSRLPKPGEMELEDAGDLQGVNFCMAEVPAALLLEGLDRLDEENRRRATSAAFLDEALGRLPGIDIVRPHARQESRSFYHYVVKVDVERLGLVDVRPLVSTLSKRLHLAVGRSYPPLNRSPLYSPWTRESSRISPEYERAIRLDRYALPRAEKAYASCITFQHRVLLGDATDLRDIVDAFERLWCEHDLTPRRDGLE